MLRPVWFLLLTLALGGCQPGHDRTPAPAPIPTQVQERLSGAGFYTEAHGYKLGEEIIVEGDIIITDSDLKYLAQYKEEAAADPYYLRLVTPTPTPLKVYLHPQLGNKLITAADQALARYNAEDLAITFGRTTDKLQADISLMPAPPHYSQAGIRGSAGFPDKQGRPYPQILLDTAYYNHLNEGELTTAIAHKLGHCLGFRHSGYPIAGYPPAIPGRLGTPGWMQGGEEATDQPFTSNDKLLLKYLY